MSNDIERKKIIEKYWLNRLSGDLPRLELPSFPLEIAGNDDIKDVDIQDEPLTIEIPDATYSNLQKIGNNVDAAVFILCLTALKVVLHRYTGTEDLVVGTMSPRKSSEKGKLLFCRDKINADFSLKDTLNQVKKTVLEAFNYSDYSFGLLFQKMQARNEGKTPELFNIAFLYDKLQDHSKQLKQFPLVLIFHSNENGALLETAFKNDRFTTGSVYRFCLAYVDVLGKISEILDQKIGAIDILSSYEKKQLEDFNQSLGHIDYGEFPTNKTIHQLFEEQVLRTPEAIAVTDPDGKRDVTYHDLNCRANRLAALLREKGIGRDSIVGMIMERSIEMVVGQLAILKAGGAYLPIDPGAPPNRVSTMLDDCRANLVLTEKGLLDRYSYTVLKGLEGNGLEPHITAPRERISDFDNLPIPDRSLIDCEKYHRLLGQSVVKNRIVIQASRGCPHNCCYCYRIWPRKQMAQSGAHLFEEVKLYYDIGIRKFDIFMININEGKRFFELIIENKMHQDIQLFFPNGFRGDLLSKEYVDLMVRAGTVNFALALETASPRLQKLINKHLKLDRFREIAEYICEKYPQVILELFTLHGIPTETEDEAQMTLDFIKSLKWVHFPYVNVLKIYHNTGMEKLALESGISKEAIQRSENLAWHELSDTLPFHREFSSEYQAEFLSNYLLNKERLLHVLPYQMKILTEDELVLKYDSYLPGDIKSFDDLLDLAGINRDELSEVSFVDESIDEKIINGLNQRIRDVFPQKKTSEQGLRVLMLDLSQFFTKDADMLYDVVDPPLGLLYILTYLNHQLGDKINGKLWKSRIDFDSLEELKRMIKEFNPQVIGVRTLSYYADFFHQVLAEIRLWGFHGPIIAGGPHVTVDYQTMLQDFNIDVAVLSEGEVTFHELIEAIIENGGKLPGNDVLKSINGIAYIPHTLPRDQFARELVFSDGLSDTIDQMPEEKLQQINQCSDLAYIIFTSGSTGKPKGVLVEHRSVVNVIHWFGRTYEVGPGTNVIQLSNYTFDPSVEQIFSTLLHGGQLFLADKTLMADKDRFNRFMVKNGIHIINFVPGTLNELLGYGKKIESLRAVISGGERLDESIKNSLLGQGYQLYNQYGPTEITIDALMDKCSTGAVTLGNPILNMRCFIMDDHYNLLPIGVVGELFIAGIGVTRGYLNNPLLTEERFITVGDTVFYKTGDLARWLPDGRIEFSGRIDHQVKVSGYRIELGEIESQLLKHHAVKEAVVIIREGEEGEKYLVAYIVSDTQPTALELREYLAWELPEYMIPAVFTPIREMPLTSTGKVDRGALREMNDSQGTGLVEYQAPRDKVEQVLVDVWQSVLGRESIGINDNFFTIGGDSIKSIQIASRLNEKGYKMEMKDLFQNPTISRLAPLTREHVNLIDQNTVTGVVPLTPVQAEFFHNLPIDHHHFNQAIVLKLDEQLDEEAVKTIFNKIQQHHDALRMAYEIGPDGNVTQINHGSGLPIDLSVFDLRNMENEEVAENEYRQEVHKIQTGINLKTGPLMKLGLFHMSDGDFLLVVVHHLVVDGLSWRILMEDIDTLRRLYLEGKPLQLPYKTDSFKTWAERLTQFANSSVFLKEKGWWKQLEEQEVEQIEPDMVSDNYMKDVRQSALHLSEDETELLLTKVQHSFGTEVNDILLTAFALSVRDTWGIVRFAVNLEGHGREDILEDINISRTIGWFTSVYPILLDTSFHDNLGRQIKEIKDGLRRLPNKGVGFGILKYLTSPENRGNMAFKVRPQISFNYLGQFDQDVKERSFTVGGRTAGNSYSPNGLREFDLDVSGMVAGGRLSMSIAFSNKQFKNETINTLTENFKKRLSQLIDFCSKREEREMTPGDFIYNRLSLNTFENIQKHVKQEISDIYPLTPMQEGMLFHALYEHTSSAYFVQMSYRIQGELDLQAAEKSIAELFQRYDILRTLFIHEGKGIERPLQVVVKKPPRENYFFYEDIRNKIPQAQKNDFVRDFKQKDRDNVFNLSSLPLMRVSVIQIDDNEYEFIWSHHHILMDGWCTAVLIPEYFEIYASHLNNRQFKLPEVIPYRNYIHWLVKQDEEEAREYWKNYLDGFEEASGIPRQTIGNTIGEGYDMQELRFGVGEDLTGRISQLAAENSVTVNTFIQTVWGILLARYNGMMDVVYGSVVSGRPSQVKGVENIVGLFINTVPVRITFDKDTSCRQLLSYVQKGAVEAERFHYYPLGNIQSHSKLNKELIDHIIIFENFPVAQEIEGAAERQQQDSKAAPLKLSGIEGYTQTNYDLNIVVSPSKVLGILFNYNSYKYEVEQLERIAKHMKNLLNQIASNPDLPITDLLLISDDERKRILGEFNNTTKNLPTDKTLHQLFEEQVEKIPDKIALIMQDSPVNVGIQTPSITYRQLDQKAHIAAMELREKGLRQDTIVAMLMPSSLEMAVIIFAILKTGSAYLPIDPSYPKERIDYILENSQASLILTSDSLDLETFSGKECLTYSSLFAKEVYTDKLPKLAHVAPKNLAYTIYTSGTTGLPKGVQVEHRNVVNTLLARREEYGLDVNHTALQLFSHSFDGFVTSFFTPLISGSRLVLMKEESLKDVRFIADTIAAQKVTHFICIPALYQAIITQLSPGESRSIQVVTLAGDTLPGGVIELTAEKNPNIEIVNEYGVTEAAVMSTIHRHQEKSSVIHVGKPIANIRVYILDDKNRLQPIGIPGELCIAGAGVARSYINNPTLTAEKFVSDPFSKDEKMYRSGDLAVWLPDGSIQLKGRLDFQVKIRGFRIELGEIENQLGKHPEIKQVTVVDELGKNNERFLCAYIVPNDNTTESAEVSSISQYRRFLGNSIPSYMIPTRYEIVDNIPLTANGKVDRKALASMGTSVTTGVEYAAPSNKIETTLSQIWIDILGIEKVGINDNFFDVGGNSINAIQVNNRIKEDLERDIPIVKLFEYTTIRTLAYFIERGEDSDSIAKEELEQYDKLQDEAEEMMAQTMLAIANTDDDDETE